MDFRNRGMDGNLTQLPHSGTTGTKDKELAAEGRKEQRKITLPRIARRTRITQSEHKARLFPFRLIRILRAIRGKVSAQQTLITWWFC